MKVVSRDSRMPQKSKPPVSTVSNALWPVDTRRRIASSTHAQKRRLIFLKGFRRSREHGKAASRCRVVALIFYVLCIMVATAFVLEGLLLVLFMARPWALLLLLTATWTVSLSVASQLLYLELPKTTVSRKATKRKMLQVVEPAQSVKQPSLLQFPDTPMPVTPLVRVLETIDLSSSEVEHFLDPAMREKDRVSQSQLSEHYSAPRDNN
jgi:hypothetical protein